MNPERDTHERRGWRPYSRLVRMASLIVPRRLRDQWADEWEAEFRHREAVLGRWQRLGLRARLDLTRRSLGALRDALWMQPRRLEEELAQDVRFGARMLLKDRLVTAVGLLTLALGIGATTAIFSVADAVLFRALPYDEPDRLVAIVELRGDRRAQITPANFLDWREQQTVFEHLAAYHVRDGAVAGGGEEPERARMAVVSASFFDALGAHATLGRAFLPEEEARGHEPVAVIGYGLWQRRFGGDPAAVGAPLRVDGEVYIVVGVMPPHVRFPNDAEVWLPPRADVPELDVNLGEDLRAVRGFGYLGAVARLAPGVPLESARAEMETITGRLRQQYPQTNGPRRNEVVPLKESLVGDMRPAIWLLLGAVACVLLVACANVANLLLARSAARRKELAIRAALGASRRRVFRQLVTESVAFALAGGALGVALAVAGVRMIVAWAPGAIPSGVELGVDLRALAVTLALSAAVGISFGVVPALRALSVEANELLKEQLRGATISARRRRFAAALVVGELALSAALLVGAGLLLRSLAELRAVPLGFETRGVVTMRVAPSGERYSDDGRRAAFYEDALAAISSLPGVAEAAAIDTLPLSPGPVNGYVVDARPDLTPDTQPGANRRVVTPDYFRAMGVPLLAGRTFSARDAAGAPGVVVVNEALARQEFGTESAVGRRLSFGVSNGQRVWLEIVGVVADVRSNAANVEPQPEAYLPVAQMSTAGMSFVVRADGDASAVAGRLRDAVRTVDPDQPVSDIRTMEEVVSGSLSRPSLYALLLGIFAALSLVMAAAGVYAVMAYAVSQRTHEIGIRMALGADRARVLRMIAGEGAALTGAGLAIGLAAAAYLARLLAGFLYGVAPTDAATFASVAGLLCAAALLACYLPVRRAAAVEPVVALRHD